MQFGFFVEIVDIMLHGGGKYQGTPPPRGLLYETLIMIWYIVILTG